MTQSILTQEQETQLAQALEFTQQFKQKLRELNNIGEVFAQKWKNKLNGQTTPQQRLSQEK